MEAAISDLTAYEREVLEELARREAAHGPEALVDWIPWATPGYRRPSHLAPFLSDLDRAEREPVRGVYSMPPRHGKTESAVHAIAKWLRRDPTEQIGYVSFNDTIAQEKAARARRLAEQVGVVLGGKDTEARWETAAGGSVVAAGVRGTLNARGFTKLLVDDSTKNSEEAESPTVREKNWIAFQADILTRLEPRGTSIFVLGTRWHTEDIAGHCIRDLGWPVVNMPALNDRDEALCEEMWPAEFLKGQRRSLTAYLWSAIYQGGPVPRGGAVFGGATHYERRAVPSTYRPGFGIDGAYSAKTHADWSVLLAGKLAYEPGPEGKALPVLYLTDCLRMQGRQPAFVAACKPRVQGLRGGWYVSTTEQGNADLMRELGLNVEGMPAKSDKFVRAQPVAAAWNAGRVRVPREAPWGAMVVDEVCRFTGLGDAHDDIVDALAALWDHLTGSGYSVVKLVQAAKGL